MKKKILSMVMAIAMVASLTACGAKAIESAGSDATAVKTVTDGVLTVATSPDFAPYEFYSIGSDGKPTLSGFDMALAQYIADDLGLKLEVVPMDFDGVLMELANKSVDIGMAGLSPDPEREKAMDFSDIYYEGGQSFVTTKANADKFKSMADANAAGISVGSQIGSIQEKLAKENTPDADLISLPKVTDLISELIGGKMDCAFIETAVAESYQKNYPDLVIICDVPYDVEGSAIGVAKGNESLLAAVNASIAKAKADGTIDKFVADANELAAGEKYEGLLDENGNVK